MSTVSLKKANFTFKMDIDTRDEFSRLCDAIGISMSAALNALVKQTVRSQSMHFSLLDENGFTPAEAREFRRRLEKAKAGEVESHELIEA